QTATTTSATNSPTKLDASIPQPAYSGNGKFALNQAKLKGLQNALDLYFTDHKSYPTALSELEANYLGNRIDSITDSFTNQPFTYTLATNNFEICGSSGQDNIELCVQKLIKYNNGIKGTAFLSSKPLAGVQIDAKSQNGNIDVRMTTQKDGSFY